MLNWPVPVRLDGGEIKQFDFATVQTSKIRVLFEQGRNNTGGALDELEAYWIS